MKYKKKKQRTSGRPARSSAVAADTAVDEGSMTAEAEVATEATADAAEASRTPKSLKARCSELERVNQLLQAQVLDLQTYIDGRQGSWSDLQKKIEQYQDALTGMEQVVRNSEEKLARKEEERAQLGTRMLDLERRCAELSGRLEEREPMTREVRSQLQEKTDEAERLRTESLRNERLAAEALEKAATQEARAIAADQALAERNEKIAGLEQQCQQLTAELDTRASECHELRARAEQGEQLAAQLQNQRDDYMHRADAARIRLHSVEAREQTLLNEVGALKAEAAAQLQLISELEAEVIHKQQMIEAARRNTAAAVAIPTCSIEAEPDEDDLEIVRVDDLLLHESNTPRKPIGLLKAPDGTAYEISKNSITIGRGRDNDICIPREFISRMHARLTTAGIGTMIEDVGSKNGILVNSKPVGRRLLMNGDVVSLGGKLNLTFVELDER